MSAKNDYDKTVSLKKQFDCINFNTDSIENLSRFDYEYYLLKQYTLNPIIRKDARNILKKIKLYNNAIENKPDTHLHLGVITSGAHSFDFANHFEFEIDSSWNFNPVLFVYECPGNNLDASVLGELSDNLLDEYDIIEKKDFKHNLHKLLGNRVWHVDWDKSHFSNPENSYGNNDYQFFENQNKYSQFLLSLIQEFKLGNLYTTNLFRYEIFNINKNAKPFDRSINLTGISELKNPKNGDYLLNPITNIFKKELNLFKPNLIISSSAPIPYIEKEYKRNSAVLGDQPPIIQVPHPAAFSKFLKRRDRYIQHVFNIIYGLYKAKIIDDEKEIKKKLFGAIKKYEEVI